MIFAAKWIKILLSDRMSYIAVTVIEVLCYVNVSCGTGAWLLFMNSKYVNIQFEGWLLGHIVISAEPK